MISPITFAELAPSAPNDAALVGFLDALAIRYDDITPATAFASGQIFRLYRKAGGPRQHLVPDFVIAALALFQADRLAAIDRGYLKQWFPRLKLLVP